MSFFERLSTGLQAMGQDQSREEFLADREATERRRRAGGIQGALADQIKAGDMDPRALRELMALDPTTGGAISEGYANLDKNRRTAQTRDLLRARGLISAGREGDAKELLTRRVAAGAKIPGANMTDSVRILADLEKGDKEAALAGIEAQLDMAIAAGDLKGDAANKSFQPVMLERTNADGSTTKMQAIPTIDSAGNPSYEYLELPEGFEVKIDTPEERMQRVLKEKREAATQKSRRAMVERGTEAAEGMANLKRAIYLLDKVETGGIDAWGQSVKQFFGVEGADEGELSTNLGIAVLANLKATFGAAFSEKEGARLERMSAGMGRSPASNRRLIDQALKLAERAAKRGLKAAEVLEDEFAIEDIQSLMDFTIDETAFRPAAVGDAAKATDEELSNRQAELEARQ